MIKEGKKYINLKKKYLNILQKLKRALPILGNMGWKENEERLTKGSENFCGRLYVEIT